MDDLKWSGLKSHRLKRTRGKSFEDVLTMRYIDVILNPAHSDQSLLLFEENGYVWVVPCAKTSEGLILKTLYPSRKYTRMFHKGEIK